MEFPEGACEGFLVLGNEGYDEGLLMEFGRMKRGIRDGVYGGVMEMAREVVWTNGHGVG